MRWAELPGALLGYRVSVRLRCGERTSPEIASLGHAQALSSDGCKCVLLRGEGRAFCAGGAARCAPGSEDAAGDVAAVREEALNGGSLPYDFFYEECVISVTVLLWDGYAGRGRALFTLAQVSAHPHHRDHVARKADPTGGALAWRHYGRRGRALCPWTLQNMYREDVVRSVCHSKRQHGSD